MNWISSGEKTKIERFLVMKMKAAEFLRFPKKKKPKIPFIFKNSNPSIQELYNCYASCKTPIWLRSKASSVISKQKKFISFFIWSCHFGMPIRSISEFPKVMLPCPLLLLSYRVYKTPFLCVRPPVECTKRFSNGPISTLNGKQNVNLTKVGRKNPHTWKAANFIKRKISEDMDICALCNFTIRAICRTFSTLNPFTQSTLFFLF